MTNLSTVDPFMPSWSSPPGETIADVLADREVPIEELGDLIGVSQSKAEGLLDGSARISASLARKLSEILGASEEFWLDREYTYRSDESRYHLMEAPDPISWLREIPTKDMIKMGWMPDSSDEERRLADTLAFFGVDSVSNWRNNYAGTLSAVNFRTSTRYKSNIGSVLSWIREGELRAQNCHCGDWNPEKLRDYLEHFRKLTWEKDPAVFLPIARRLCAECGVALVASKAPDGCRASGATKFLPSGHALVLLSFRFLADDQLWFTFFHELGHVLLHNKRALFVEDESDTETDEELEANVFARQTLIPDRYEDALLSVRIETRTIIRLATKIGVAPGIIVGQLQHMNRIPSHWLNRLKRRYNWADLGRNI